MILSIINSNFFLGSNQQGEKSDIAVSGEGEEGNSQLKIPESNDQSQKPTPKLTSLSCQPVFKAIAFTTDGVESVLSNSFSLAKATGECGTALLDTACSLHEKGVKGSVATVVKKITGVNDFIESRNVYSLISCSMSNNKSNSEERTWPTRFGESTGEFLKGSAKLFATGTYLFGGLQAGVSGVFGSGLEQSSSEVFFHGVNTLGTVACNIGSSAVSYGAPVVSATLKTGVRTVVSNPKLAFSAGAAYVALQQFAKMGRAETWSDVVMHGAASAIAVTASIALPILS